MSESLQQILDDYWSFLLDENPDIAYDVGDPRGRDAFYRHGLDDLVRQEQGVRNLADRLSKIDQAGLDQRGVLDYALADRALTDQLAAFDLKEHFRPQYFPFGPDLYVSYCISAMSLETAADYGDYLTKLASLPQMFCAHQERLMKGLEEFGFQMPSILLPRVLASLKSFIDAPTDQSIWMQPLNGAANDVREKATALIDQEIRPAYQAWHDLLAGPYAQNGLRDTVGLCDDEGGKQYYDYLVRHHTGTELSPASIHQLGLDEVARLTTLLEDAAASAGYGGRVKAYRDFLNSDASQICASKDELLQEIETLAKRIDRKIPELFGRLPRMTYGVELIPLARSEQMPGAYAQPNPPSGETAGIFWLNSLPNRVPRHQHVPLTLHEAWPGHLMHVALMQELEEVPEFARFNLAGYMAYIEGWALYTERLGDQIGLISEDWQRFGVLEMELFRAIRLVVDTGLHAFGWSRQQAIDYVMSTQPQAQTTVEAEIDRYIGMPGQALAYKVGELAITGWRKKAEAKLGDKFRLREFHDAVMSTGPVTIAMLDDYMENWLTKQEQAA